ncbi:hypothetical protein L1987_84039 [Smallanthus sonchifolius]|uniref:Uncharacterized protein n=1 Tax=Smallanthus sonchifolius TaxID=185202 RepID=A0ACB8YEJ2_9ASTR|nr:hypothetical protein L1987_84039 [Smallanthus sonchifolius]
MFEKRKRGTSTGKKKRSSSDPSGIKFNANGIAIGQKVADFMSWVGAEFKNRVLINKVAKDVDSKLYDRIWEYAKETWKISDDHAKHATLRKGKVIMRNFRSYLVVNYVNKNKTPFKVYKNIDRQIWDSVVANASKEEFKSVEKCDLLWPYDPLTPLVLGKGLVHFTTERTLHGRSMKDGFVKVQVDRVEEGCTQMPLLPESCIPGEFGATSDKQTMPNETNAYRRYSYALRDDEGFYELLADDHFSQNRTEPVQFYQQTELVNVYDQHTKSIHVSQHTETVPASESEKENEKIAKEKKDSRTFRTCKLILWLLGMSRKHIGGDERLMELKFGGDRSLMEVRS